MTINKINMILNSNKSSFKLLVTTNFKYILDKVKPINFKRCQANLISFFKNNIDLLKIIIKSRY